MENSNNYIHLQSLLESEANIPEQHHNVIGWKIMTEAGSHLGETIDLLYDPNARTVRYLVLEIGNNGTQLHGKQTLIPVGIATLHPELDEIIVPHLHADQLELLPEYISGEMSHKTEQRVREVIGSPAALRMEETIIEFDQQAFYAHHHFDSDRFFSRNATPSQINTQPREEESQTIHELVENSKANGMHAVENQTDSITPHNDRQAPNLLSELERDNDLNKNDL